MAEFVSNLRYDGGCYMLAYEWLAPSKTPAPNVWLGVSVENADHLYRIDELRKTPAAIKFVSFEPLLGSLGQVNLEGLDWAIFGCESNGQQLGRPMRLEWVRDGVKQCQDANVAAFVKQIPIDGRLSKNIDEWPQELQVQQFPPSIDN